MIMSTFTTSAETRKFTLAPLPYAYNALEPEISEETLRYHHDKHHAAYLSKLNTLATGTPYAKMTLDEVAKRCNTTKQTIFKYITRYISCWITQIIPSK